MKTTFAYLIICLSLFTFSDQLIAQESGKYYAFSTDSKRIRKVKVEYDQKDKSLDLSTGRSSLELYIDHTVTYKAYKGTMFYREGSNAKRAFLLEDGSFLLTEKDYSKASGDCKVTYNKAKDKTIIYLAKDKAKASAMNKEKAIKLFEQYFSKVCEAYKAYEEARLSGTKLPAEGMKNKKLLPEATKAAQMYMKRKRWRETLVGSYFYSREWNTIRNKNTGRILGRRLRLIGLLSYKGRCSFGHFFIRQDYDGAKYGVTYCEANSRTTRVSCKKVAAKKP